MQEALAASEVRQVSGERIAGLVVGFFLLLHPVRAEWTLTAYVGGAHTAQTSLQLRMPQSGTNLLFEPISYEGRSFQSPLYYGYRAGYFFTRHFGLESEFTHLKVYAETDPTAQISGSLQAAPMNESAGVNSVIQRFNITHGVNLLLANFVGRRAFRGQGRSAHFLVSGRVGVGFTIPHPENDVFGHLEHGAL